MKKTICSTSLFIVAPLLVGWILSAVTRTPDADPPADSADSSRAPRLRSITGESQPTLPDRTTFREWFAELRQWSHADGPGTALETSSRQVRTDRFGKQLVTRLSKAAMLELSANANSSNTTSIAAAAERDIDATLNTLLAKKSRTPEQLAAALGTFATREPEAAYDRFLNQISAAEQTPELRQGLLELWALRDGEAAMRAAGKTELITNRSRHDILLAWAVTDILPAMNFLREHLREITFGAGPGYNSWASGTFCRLLARHDPATLKSWLASFPDELDRHSLTRAAMIELTAIDPQQAISLLAALPANWKDEDTINAFTQRWANVDPQGVLAWAEQLADTKQRALANGLALDALAQRSPSAAAEILKSLPVPKTGGYVAPPYQAACDCVAELLFESDREATEIWLNELPEDVLEIALPTVYEIACRDLEPDAAWDYLSTRPEDKAKTEVVARLVANRSHTDPNGALALAAGLDPGATRDAAIHNAIGSLAKTDFEAATAFVAEMPPSPGRDDALIEITLTGAASDPSRSLESAAQIANPEKRMAATKNSLIALAQLDASAALGQLGQLDATVIPDSQREELRNSIDQMAAMREFLRSH